jgi:signal transduction histidine kinase
VFETISDASEHTPARFYTAPILNNGQLVGLVQVAQDLEDMHRALRRLLKALLLGGPVLVVIAGVGGYFLAARALAPIDAITRTTQRIAGGTDLSARLRASTPTTEDEVGRLSATLDAMLGRLDDAFRRERQFLADASHELRTPLAALQAILNVIREGQRSPEDYRQALADIADETDRLRNLVEDLLRLARGGAPAPLAPEPVNLSALLQDVADSLHPLAEAKGLALTCRVPDGLTLSGSSDDLIRLFVNLVDNAIKYTDAGEVAVTASGHNGSVWVSIADTGQGIPPEHLSRIFDRFYRVEASRTAPGSGLGLAIALDVARAHGGTIEVSSAVGAGTTFNVQFPRSGRAG